MANIPQKHPTYTVVVKGWGTNFAPGQTVAVFENAVNLGYSSYLNDVPQAFFTVSQSDKRLKDVASLLAYGDGHLQIYRNDRLGHNDLMFGGFFGQEMDEREGDIIIYSYGYLSAFYWGFMPWGMEWDNQTVQQIVQDTVTWTKGGSIAAGNGPTYSMVKWCTTGTLEAPVTTTGGSTPITLPLFQAPGKRPLFVLREMAAFSQSDTSNRVWFEITPAGVINFWKNKGVDRTTEQWIWPAHDVISFHRFRRPTYRRNALLTVGSNARDVAMRTIVNNGGDQAAHGYRADSIYFQWVRDTTELSRLSNLRLTKALRGDKSLSLTLAPGSFPPVGATNGLAWGDTILVSINRGATQMSREKKIVVGQQVIMLNDREYFRPVLQDAP